MNKLTIYDLDLRGKRVFIRVDFNVPLKDGIVTDDTRIRETIPTLRLAIQKGGRLILASHLGRPKGGPDPKYSLLPVAKKLEELLGKTVRFASDCVGPVPESKSKTLADGDVLLLENVRFHPEEEKNDETFSKQLAALCDGLFICDAFGSAHRAHASVAGITRFVNVSAAGLLMEKELAYLGKALTNPTRPFVAILGGAKVSDKIEVVENLMNIADAMLIGGGMAYTFFKAQGLPIGKSLVEDDKLDLAHKILANAKQRNFRLLLPVDHLVASEFKADARATALDIAATPADQMGLDIGPKTAAAFASEIARAKTIVWNGPMGVFEMPAFANGTLEVARAVAAATGSGATSIVGGGDSVAAVHKSGVASRISHISTGGGASLEFLAGAKLPGVEALTDRPAALSVTQRVARRRVIAGNWKMFKTRIEAEVFFSAFTPLVQGITQCDIVIAPPFTALHAAFEAARGSQIAIGAQDVFWEREGAFTGEISPPMLVELGCHYVIIGHSERRQFFGETDETVAKKAKTAVAVGLIPIVCIGETLQQRESGSTEQVCRSQFSSGPGSLTPDEFSRILIAYEPVWAIGTGRTATPEMAAQAHAAIRQCAAEKYSATHAAALRILYGGSVKPDNIDGLMAQEEIDGALVGGASLDAKSFASIVNGCAGR
ncbi:MAG TPA: triose-phosphate isomerase [Candidatus Methylomirabilis sp.]|nr:triose-phosphate isomerase [Candidatus Methylomirabilis sp.]